VSADGGWANAMAVAGGRILAFGSDADMAKYTGEGSAVHDLQGRMVMPGIHDTHNHPPIRPPCLNRTLPMRLSAMIGPAS